MCAKISIIVPVYKVEKYLKRCVDSILCQTFSDIEIILVDDGSPDNCGLMCDEYAELDKRVKVIHKQNGGLSSARNAGLDIASGDYIGFVDSDDWIHPQMYEILYYYIVKFDLGIVKCKHLKVTNEDGVNNTEPYIDDNIRILDYDEILNNFNDDIHYSLISPIVCNKLYKKNIFNSLRFDENRIHEDEIIMLPSIFLAKTVGVIKQQLYYYFYTRPDSIMNTGFSVKSFDDLYGCYAKYVFFDKLNYILQAQKYQWLFLHKSLKMYKKLINDYPQYVKEFKKFCFKDCKLKVKCILNNSMFCDMEKLIFILFRFNQNIALRLYIKYYS